MNVELGDESSGDVSSAWAAALPYLGTFYAIKQRYEILSVLGVNLTLLAPSLIGSLTFL